jgi:chromosome partitioning protein
VLDLDGQCSATAWIGPDPKGGRGLFDVLIGNSDEGLAPLVVPSVIEGVDLIPGSPQLVGLDKAAAGEVGAEGTLRDVLLIDCPPALGLALVSALVAVDGALIPVEASTMALQGLAQLTRTLDAVRERLGADLAIAGVLLCRLDPRTVLARDLRDRLEQRFGDAVLVTPIRETIRLREAPAWRQPITTYDPGGNGAEDYRAATRELVARLGLANTEAPA